MIIKYCKSMFKITLKNNLDIIERNNSMHASDSLYRAIFKRLFDIVIALLGIIAFSWLYIVLILLGMFFMNGNPFFLQDRPGKDEKIFKLIKFRTMNNKKDKNGVLLPDEMRLNKYGRFLRSTSLDEIPELINVLCGDISIIGPRPLLVEYLPFYTEEEHTRHKVKPGLTGIAQINGRNYLSWEDKFKMDIWYANNISLFLDIKIFLKTIYVVFKRKDIETASSFVHNGVVYQPLDVERKSNFNAP